MSTAPALDSRAHSAAIRAAVDANLGQWHAYNYDDVPGSPQASTPELRDADLPPIYVAVAVDRRFAPPRRSTGQVGRSGWRVSLRAVGTTVDEARWALKRINEALDEARLTVDGKTTTGLQHETSTDAELDEGRYSGLVIFTYTV